ncbi:flagellar motor protein MotB [Pelagibius sp. Alg239-R121]|uniref:flagellar motor protein MotB n=1 Tax=Pelagibius sp. Alg239-R121 TaxID=2993448 RepID=UPI0024A7A131|nr:flagellar motor protein MotB [Pelagibius sp. Alg239-R121]
MTPPDLHSEETLDVASQQLRVVRPLLTEAPRPSNSSTAWMVTFTDLVALMLTFFVLLYSMSRLDVVQWQNLTGSLARSLDSVTESTAVKPKAQLDIAPVRFVPGADLDYLANVLSERLRTDDTLSQALFRNQGDRLVISLPDALIFDAGSEELGAQAEQTMFALGGVFRTISNSIEIVSYPIGKDRKNSSPEESRTAREAAWTQALSRAITLSRLLAGAGYAGAIRPKGVAWDPGNSDVPDNGGWAAEGTEQRSGHRIDVIVLDTAGER